MLIISSIRTKCTNILVNYLRPLARTNTKNYRNNFIIMDFFHVDSYRILVNYVTLFLLSSYNLYLYIMCVCVCVEHGHPQKIPPLLCRPFRGNRRALHDTFYYKDDLN